MALPNGTLLREGRYQVQRLLARGGFGFVYLTRDTVTDRQVVLKELIPVLVNDTEVLRRFVREGRAMQRLSHPHIARVDAMFKDSGNHYIVIEYLPGDALSERVGRGRKLDLSQAALIGVALCDALVYMHQRGITHCDLNPSNVLFDSQGRPKMVDLGIAHVSDSFVHRSWYTQRNITMGTVFYMAPEQLDGVRDDPRVDMYALAAMLYEMLSGRPYLDFGLASTPSAQAENIRRVHQEAPAPIPEVPPQVNEVILRALAKHPDDRYPDVAHFRQQLIRALFPHLPPDKGISLVAPFRSVTEGRPGALDTADWPRWIWVALVVMNLIVMIAFAVLLLGSL